MSPFSTPAIPKFSLKAISVLNDTFVFRGIHLAVIHSSRNAFVFRSLNIKFDLFPLFNFCYRCLLTGKMNLLQCCQIRKLYYLKYSLLYFRAKILKTDILWSNKAKITSWKKSGRYFKSNISPIGQYCFMATLYNTTFIFLLSFLYKFLKVLNIFFFSLLDIK